MQGIKTHTAMPLIMETSDFRRFPSAPQYAAFLGLVPGEHSGKAGAYLSEQHETALMEYRDQLSAFDQTIQEYQNMLDGNRALPEQMKLEDVSKLLDATRAAREQFLQQGAAELNRVSDSTPT